MTTDFSLMDIMGNFTGGAVSPDDTTDSVSTATTGVVTTPQVIEKKPSFINPKYAVKTEAVAPAEGTDTYGRMLQAESGNKDYDAQGRPITSSKGAMFAGQVMPATAANPGFGIKPAANQTPEEYNRVGREYYQALLKQFGGDEQKAVAAYNAGPGRVSQNIAANQGQLNVAQLPRETQGYLGKVLKGVGNVVEGMIPSAQAGTLPSRPAAPVAPQTETAVNPETGETYQRLVKQAAPASGAVNPAEPLPSTSITSQPVASVEVSPQGDIVNGVQTTANPTHVILNSNSQEGIAKLAFNPNTAPADKSAAADKLRTTMAVQKGMADAKETAARLGENPDPRALSKAMNDKDTGSYFKVLMYQALGWTGKAKQELNKIDPEVTYAGVTMQDGTAYNVKTNKETGETIAAWDNQGKRITDPTVLGSIAANGTTGFKLESTRQDLSTGHTISVLKNDKTGQVRYRDDTTGQVLPTAPQHLGNVGTKSPEALIHDKATASANAAMQPMIRANTQAAAAGGAPRFTEEQIQSAGSQAYSRINPSGSFGGAYTPGQAPAKKVEAPAGGPAPTAAPQAGPSAPGAAPTKPVAGPSVPKTYAQQVLDGDAPPPSGQSGQRAAVMEQVQKLAAEQGKTYDPTTYNVRKKTEESFTTGKQGDTVKSMNVAIDHLDTLGDAAKALKNGQIPLFNKVANLYATNTGQTAPGNFDALKSIVGSEVAKAVAGGATALGDREEIRKEINNSKTPEQLAGIIDKYQRLLAGQMTGLKTQYEGGGGKNWDKKINSRTNEVMDKIHNEGKVPAGVPAPYSDAGKEARYQEYLKKRNAGK
jgi:hypothetical protein